MGSSLLLALVLSAWPLPRDAGASAYADPANWPEEPEWSAAWPLFSFTPANWAVGAEERDAGVGMSVDRAWSITRGDPSIVLAIAARQHDLSDPTVARAWRLNPGEFPDAGDTNGNGRLDVTDFTVADVNANGAIDLEDLIAARADGVDQDGNGRTDDLCGWDFGRDAPISTTIDAGSWRRLAAPVGDGLPGIGVCPDCTLLPVGTSTASLPAALRFAADAGVRALLLPNSAAEISTPLEQALSETGRRMVLVLEGTGGFTTLPLALHPAVISPRTLTEAPGKTSALSRRGCGGAAIAGSISVSSASCSAEAAEQLVGLAGLIFSVRPSLEAGQVIGLLGGERVDAHRAVLMAEAGPPSAITPLQRLRPLALATPASQAEFCAVNGEPLACDGGVPLSATGPFFIRYVERQGPYEWSTAIPAPPPGALRGFLGVSELGPGSGPPRFVDIDGLGSESILAGSPRGLVGFTDQVEVLSPALPASRLALAFGDVDGDRALDIVTVSDDGLLQVSSLSGAATTRQLDAGLAGPPQLAATLDGTALVTLDVNGRLTHRLPTAEWTFELGERQLSGPATGLIDGDAYADFAIANGRELRVLITDTRGPRVESWRAPSRATQALLGNLIGDAELEIVAERVFDARGQVLLELGGWAPSVVPPALARIDDSAHRALLQVELRSDGRFDLTRYDVERALRQGDSLVERRVLRTIDPAPARGGFAVADVTGDRRPDVLLPTEEGLLFIIDGEGESPFESPLPTLGSVISSPAVGVARDRLEFAVRTTRGDLVRFLGRGPAEDITWESAGHDRANTWNAETKLPIRRLSGLGITEPPVFEKPCGCTSLGGTAGLGLVFLFRRRRRTC
ncbi:MAG: hypothetical protein Q8K32_36870 [Archangium sp.]|nr:hypothetical protein [Archangium sp.]